MFKQLKTHLGKVNASFEKHFSKSFQILSLRSFSRLQFDWNWLHVFDKTLIRETEHISAGWTLISSILSIQNSRLSILVQCKRSQPQLNNTYQYIDHHIGGTILLADMGLSQISILMYVVYKPLAVMDSYILFPFVFSWSQVNYLDIKKLVFTWSRGCFLDITR